MEKKFYRRLETFLFWSVGILTFALLLYLWVVPNIETVQTRDASGYIKVENVDYRELYEDGGLVRQFRFTLDNQIEYDTTLIFRYHHHSADVYLDGELVYCLHPSGSLRIVQTPGGHWAMIPLFREDEGKEVLVELRPVYSDYQEQKMQFFIGSKLSVYTEQLRLALPEMFLGLADVFAGVLLLAIAVFFTFRKQSSGRLYALATLSIALGIWNFTQTNFSTLLIPEKNVFLYYVSMTMLSISVFALVQSARLPRETPIRKTLDILTIVYGVFVIGQMILQLCGLMDLRQSLKGVHAALILTSGILIYQNLAQIWKGRRNTEEITKVGSLWILGIGVLLDLLNYYDPNGSGSLVYVLLAVLVYVLLEGAQVFITYIQQRQALEEKETQLTMSRITTMMSQIRSHFVFNVLNAISGMCKYDPEKADETVVRFSRYLRSNIDIMEDDKNVPFLQEMERLEDYVVLEQIRFGDRIEFVTDIQADQFAIPPLILQPIVENAIKHGISKRQEGGRILLSTRDTGKHIVITITDNGIGFPIVNIKNMIDKTGCKVLGVVMNNVEFKSLSSRKYYYRSERYAAQYYGRDTQKRRKRK